MNPNPSTCGLCGEPMPEGEETFMYHGYSGPCPKPPLQNEEPHPTGQCRGGCKLTQFPLYGSGVIRCDAGAHRWRVERL